MPRLSHDWSEVKTIAPELSCVVGLIEKFLKEVQDHHIEPGRLVRIHDLSRDRTEELHLALEVARDRKLVKRSWGVIAPTTRCHAQGYWDRLSKIPKVLYDSGDDRFRRSDGTFITVYRHPDEAADE